MKGRVIVVVTLSTSLILASFVTMTAAAIAPGTVDTRAHMLGCPTYPYGEPEVVQALGDSYSTGEGLGCYESRTDTSTDTCHRSAYAYSSFVASTLVGHGFYACSGATTASVVSDSRSSEPPQVEHVSNDPSVVTLTIGGNNIGFATLLRACISVSAGIDYYYPLGAVSDEDIPTAGKRMSAGWRSPTRTTRSAIRLSLEVGLNLFLVATYEALLARVSRPVRS